MMCGHMRCEYRSKREKHQNIKGGGDHGWGWDEKAVTTGRKGIPFNTTDTDTVVVNNNNNRRR